MSQGTNESTVDFSVLCTPKIDENIRNSLIFLRKMASCSCFSGTHRHKITCKHDASMIFLKPAVNRNRTGGKK